MSEHPFFSVIVPEHNASLYMRKGLDSIKEQIFKNYELIIVCDKCTDNTAEIAKEYTDKVLEVNYGRAGQARNAALDIAKGDWILFMDDDDWFLHEYAFTLLNYMIEKNDDMDILAFSFIWKNKGYARNTPINLWPAPWNKAWKRSFIGDERFPDWEHSEDAEFAERMHPRAKVVYWDMPLYYYNYMREGSLTWKLSVGELKPLNK